MRCSLVPEASVCSSSSMRDSGVDMKGCGPAARIRLTKKDRRHQLCRPKGEQTIAVYGRRYDLAPVRGCAPRRRARLKMCDFKALARVGADYATSGSSSAWRVRG